METLLKPIFLHILMCAGLYAFLTIARAPAIWRIGAKQDGSNPFGEIQPRISANLSNQFEWPVFFYVVCLILMFSDNPISTAQISLAWVFVFGRLIHSCVQIFTSNVRLRGIVFTINFVAVLAMWGLLFIESSDK